MFTSLGHKSVATNHCLFLPSAALVINFLLDKSLQPNSYSLTAFLVFNYVLLTLLLIRTNNALTTLIFTSFVFAITSCYLLSLDCIVCLTFWSFVSNYCYMKLFSKISSNLRSSFSLGELLIVSQLSVAYLSSGSVCLVSHLINSSKTSLFCSANTPNLVLQVIFVGIASIVLSQIISANNSFFRKKYIDIISIFVIIFTTFCSLFSILRTNPIQWLSHFLFSDPNRNQLMMSWVVMLGLTILFAALFSITTTTRANTMIRKLFHICIAMVCVIGIKRDVILLSFSSASLLVVFIFLEVLRIRRIPPIGSHIEHIFEKFRDEKDIGLFTLTHIYLLVGTCLPIWLTPQFNANNIMAMTSGVITVGIGDTAAAIGGSFFGRHRWKGSKKTYEGTVLKVSELRDRESRQLSGRRSAIKYVMIDAISDHMFAGFD